MTHKYTVKGITCDGCVAKVKSKLLMHPDVLAADITLKDQRAIITMQKHLSVSELQEAIGNDSKYKISLDSNQLTHSEASDEAKSWLATYKPLLIIVAFITGIAAIISNGNLYVAMNSFMAGFFVTFSFFKLLDLKAFASSYSMYDLLAKRIPAYGYIYPFIELGLGLSYLTGFSPYFTNLATVVILGFSSIGVIQSVLNKKQIRCACLGAVFNLPMSTVTIVEDLLMAGMAGTMLV
ncbi:MAG TPA: cation transporter [Cyclobacteriaceae bacterium]|nr:cation transporter [Cyclobacteriaceae bacterium]